MNDPVERAAAIDALSWCNEWDVMDFTVVDKDDAIHQIKALPSAKPEIVRCKDCKYRDENWRRVSVRWLPCMDVRTGSNWYCGSAERRTDE